MTATPLYRRDELPDVARNLAQLFVANLAEDIVRARSASALVIANLYPSAAAYVGAAAYSHLLVYHGQNTAEKFMEALALAR